MKPLFFGAILLAAASVHAQLLKPIDVHQLADVNDKTVDMPTVNFDTVPQPTRTQPNSPLTGQRREPASIVETKQVDTHMLSHDNVAVKVLSQQNFSPKRATVAGNAPSPPAVDMPKADIKKRVIRGFTPAGAEELKKQLNEPH